MGTQGRHTHTHTHTQTHTAVQICRVLTVLYHFFLQFSSFSVSPDVYVPTFHSDSLPGFRRKPDRMQSVSGAGMIGQWEAGCHWTLTQHITHTHKHVHTLTEHKHTLGQKKREGDSSRSGKARCLVQRDVLFPHEVITSFWYRELRWFVGKQTWTFTQRYWAVTSDFCSFGACFKKGKILFWDMVDASSTQHRQLTPSTHGC